MHLGKKFSQLIRRLHQWKGLSRNLSFYFGVACFVLLGLLCVNSYSLAQLSYLKVNDAAISNAFYKTGTVADATADLFSSPKNEPMLETPDLKIVQDDFVYGISTPRILTTQTLGALFGGSQQRTEPINYSVQPGDTVQSVADHFAISANTVLWANDLSRGAALQAGQTLVILPVSGVIHVVKAGDTLDQIAKTYQAKVDDIIAFNGLASISDLYIGDILIIPNGVMPAKAAPIITQTPLAGSFFIYPAQGIITQGLHYFNAVDLANKCGTPIYAAAAGTVQRAVGNDGWNYGMGNYITVLHSNGVVTYYGHLMTLFVKPGDQVDVGDRIALMGRTGDATGCHVHFQVMGAANPLAKFAVGTTLKYK